MTTRYTTADIEIHLSDLTEGMGTDGLDVDASNRNAAELVKQAITRAYPALTVHVFPQQAQGHSIEIAGYPERLPGEDADADVDVDVEAHVRQIAENALGPIDEGRWFVLTYDDDNGQGYRVSVWPTDDGGWSPEVRDADGRSVYVGGEDDADDVTAQDAFEHGWRLLRETLQREEDAARAERERDALLNDRLAALHDEDMQAEVERYEREVGAPALKAALAAEEAAAEREWAQGGRMDEQSRQREDQLILLLCAEAGEQGTPEDLIDGFRGNHHPDLIAAAAQGDVAALVELRNASGLPVLC